MRACLSILRNPLRSLPEQLVKVLALASAIATKRPKVTALSGVPMTSPAKRPKRTFFPRRRFDQDLRDFVRLAIRRQWQFSGVDFEQLARDGADQSEQRARINEAEATFNAAREQFARDQEQRYRRFAMALKAARAAFRGDARVSAWLDRFKTLKRAI